MQTRAQQGWHPPRAAGYSTSGGQLENVLRVRAANDLDCSPDAVRVVVIDLRTPSVRGLPKRVTYVQSCDGYGCTWIQNGEIHDTASDDSE